MRALLIILGLALSHGALAKEACDHCGMMLAANTTESANAQGEELAKYDDKYKIEGLSINICSIIADQGNQIAPKVNIAIEEYLKKHEGIKNPTKAQKIKFLNRNKDIMTCDGKHEHYMKHALDKGKYREVFTGLFGDLGVTKDGLHVDVNAVTLHADVRSAVKQDAEPETVLDYVDFIIATNKYGEAYSKELKRFRRSLTKYYGAKKFSELPADVQAHYRKALTP